MWKGVIIPPPGDCTVDQQINWFTVAALEPIRESASESGGTVNQIQDLWSDWILSKSGSGSLNRSEFSTTPSVIQCFRLTEEQNVMFQQRETIQRPHLHEHCLHLYSEKHNVSVHAIILKNTRWKSPQNMINRPAAWETLLLWVRIRLLD